MIQYKGGDGTTQVKAIVDSGVQVAIVIGGGNILRGAGLAAQATSRWHENKSLYIFLFCSYLK